MLVLLRLAIGWHFFIEGMDKLHTPTWTSAGYLREATGPLAPRFRALAGDTLVQILAVYDLDGPISAYWIGIGRTTSTCSGITTIWTMNRTGKAAAALERVKGSRPRFL